MSFTVSYSGTGTSEYLAAGIIISPWNILAVGYLESSAPESCRQVSTTMPGSSLEEYPAACSFQLRDDQGVENLTFHVVQNLLSLLMRGQAIEGNRSYVAKAILVHYSSTCSNDLCIDADSGQQGAFSITESTSSLDVGINFFPVDSVKERQNISFMIDGIPYVTTQGDDLSVPVVSGEHTVDVASMYPLGEGVRAVFMKWEDNFSNSTRQLVAQRFEDIKLVANYKIQYYLNLTSPVGIVKGEGWYDAGSTALLSVNPSEFRTQNILGLFGARTTFAYWNGDASVPASGVVVMDKPHSLQAVWQTNVSTTYLSAGVLAGFILILSISLAARRPDHRKAEPS